MQNQRRAPRKPVQANYRGSRARMRARKKKRRKIILAFVALLLLIIILVGSCGNSNDNVNSFSDEFIQAAQQETEFEKTLSTYTAKPTQIPTQEIVQTTQNPTQSPTTKPSRFPQMIFNKNGVKISIANFDRFGVLGPEIKIAIENSSGMDLIINMGSLHCDGWQVAEYTCYVEVANEAKAGETIYIYSSELEDCGLSSGELVNVQFKGASLMSTDYMNKYEFEMTATLQ